MKNRKMYVGATVGLVFGVTALAPVLPIVTSTANVYAEEVANVEVADYAELYDAIVNGTAAKVTLTADITDLTQIMEIPEGRTVTIDLGGHTLTVRDTGDRGLSNRGNTTIINGRIRNGSYNNDSYGVIDNFGTLVLENVTLMDYGANMGSSIRSYETVYLNAGTVISGVNADAGNTGVYACRGDVFVADGVEVTSASTEYYPFQVKKGNLTIGTINSANPAKITSKMAGIYIFGDGQVTINNAEITSESRQSIRVEANDANLVINGGKYTAPYGGVYIYTTERGTEPLVTINDGEFSGDWASIVSTNRAGDLETWAFDIKGGIYAGTRIREYLTDGYRAYKIANYFENGWNGYRVDAVSENNIPGEIYMKKGTSESLGLSETALKYATFEIDKSDVATISNGRISVSEPSIVKVITNINDGSDPVTTTVYAYEMLLSVSITDGEGLDTAALEAALKEGEKKIGYVDISYASVIDGVELERITEVEDPITILAELPELPAVADGYKRSYRLLQYINGEVVEITDAVMNASAGTLGFQTKTFSPFLVTYTDTLIPVEEEQPKEDSKDDPHHPLIPKDNTFDFDDPADVDPLGETHTQPAVKPATSAAPGVPNTSEAKESSEINLMLAMMIGSVTMTAMVLGLEKAVRKR